MIVWQGDWRAFDAPEGEEHFLRELRAETGEKNPHHPLHGKAARILGWRVRGWKHFLLHLPAENRYAYVHLTWSAESDPGWPYCELFNNESAANAFLWEWGCEDVRNGIGGLLMIVSRDDEARTRLGRILNFDVAEWLVRRWFDDLYRPEDPSFRSFFDEAELLALADFNSVFAARRSSLPVKEMIDWWSHPAWQDVAAAAAVALAAFPDPKVDDAAEGS